MFTDQNMSHAYLKNVFSGHECGFANFIYVQIERGLHCPQNEYHERMISINIRRSTDVR